MGLAVQEKPGQVLLEDLVGGICIALVLKVLLLLVPGGEACDNVVPRVSQDVDSDSDNDG